MPNTVRLHRVLATKPDKVYRAFIEADAMAKWLPPNGFACTVHHLDAKVGGSFRMSFRNFTTGKSHSFGGQYLTRARRAPALHGQIRRSQSAGRNPGDGGAQASVLRHRAEYRAGRSSRRHSGGSVLSRLAGFVAKSRESRRARNQSIDVGWVRLIRLAPRRRSRPSSTVTHELGVQRGPSGSRRWLCSRQDVRLGGGFALGRGSCEAFMTRIGKNFHRSSITSLSSLRDCRLSEKTALLHGLVCVEPVLEHSVALPPWSSTARSMEAANRPTSNGRGFAPFARTLRGC